MTTIERTGSTTRPRDAVFRHLVDLRNAVEWDGRLGDRTARQLTTALDRR